MITVARGDLASLDDLPPEGDAHRVSDDVDFVCAGVVFDGLKTDLFWVYSDSVPMT